MTAATAGSARDSAATVSAPVAGLHPPPQAARGDQHRLAAGRTPAGANVKQIVQPVSGGPVTLLDVPRPVPEPTEVLVRTLSSVISPGTERAVTALAQSSLLAKARARPDLVRQVVRKARTEGLAVTRQAVLGRLAQDVPLGYSAAGIVLEAGLRGHRDPARPARRDRRGGQGEPRGVPGRARAALRAGPRRRQRPGRRVHHHRVHRPARAAHARRWARARRSWWWASG